MKNLLTLFAFLLLFCNVSYSQVSAVTEHGDSVYLWDDGTWQFANTDSSAADSSSSSSDVFTIDTNSTQFAKSANALKVLKGEKVKYELWYDADKWNQTNSNRTAVEYILHNNENEVTFMIIPERLTTTTYGILNIAVTNASNQGVVDSVEYEMRKVNNTDVAMMKMYVNINDVHYFYMSYYYTAENKTIQLITYTYLNLADEYMKDMEELLNGFVVP
jgi:hypothetical protein